MALFSHFNALRPYSAVKCDYFISVKKRHLHAAPDNLRKVFPSALSHRGQEGKETFGARLGSLAIEGLCLLHGDLMREARTSASGRAESDSRTGRGARRSATRSGLGLDPHRTSPGSWGSDIRWVAEAR